MRNRRIKMIGFDLDGTLLTEKKEVTERTRRALADAVSQGVTVLPATGRPKCGLPLPVTEIQGIRYALTSNGARILDMQQDRILYEKLVSYEIAEKLLDIFRKYDTLLEVYYDGVGYAEERYLERMGEFFGTQSVIEYVRATRNPVEDIHRMFREMKRPTDKIQAVFANQDEKHMAYADIAAVFGEKEIEATGSLHNNIEINARGVNKGKGLLYLGEMLGIEREEIMAFGDGANDIEMLKEAGVGVAMENGIPEVKLAADYVTGTNEEDGVADAIEKYVLV